MLYFELQRIEQILDLTLNDENVNSCMGFDTKLQCTMEAKYICLNTRKNRNNPVISFHFFQLRDFVMENINCFRWSNQKAGFKPDFF